MKTGLSCLQARPASGERAFNHGHGRLSNLIINRRIGEGFVISDNITITIVSLEVDGFIIDIAAEAALPLMKHNGYNQLAKQARCALQTGEDLLINNKIIIRAAHV